MDFQELQYHLGSAVSVDHLEGESYFARNCISGKTCVIEELPVYSDVTLCHYFHVLGVSVPASLNNAMLHYQAVLSELDGIFVQVNRG